MSERVNKALTKFWFPKAQPKVLALVRILFSGTLLFDALIWFSRRHELFSNVGQFGAEGAKTWYASPVDIVEHFDWFVPLMTPGAIDVLSAINIIALICLLVGARCREATIAAFFCAIVFHTRNYMVFDSGHALSRWLLFLLIFAPTGSAWSVDAWTRKKLGKDVLPVKDAWSVRLIQVQMSILYITTFLYKLLGDTWRNGEAVYYTTRSPVYLKPWVSFLFENRLLNYFMGYGALALEAAFAIFIWIPQWRVQTFILATLFHLMMDQVFYINVFEWVMIAGLMCFLQDQDLKNWASKIETLSKRFSSSKS